MEQKRKRYSEEFKAKVALEALREMSTISEIAGRYGLHPNQVTQWRNQLHEGAGKIFVDGRTTRKSDENKEAMLYQQIGQLQVELEWLKKKCKL